MNTQALARAGRPWTSGKKLRARLFDSARQRPRSLRTLDRVVAQVNLEMLGRPDPDAPGLAWITGMERSELGEWLAWVVKEHPHEAAKHLLPLLAEAQPAIKAGQVDPMIARAIEHAQAALRQPLTRK